MKSSVRSRRPRGNTERLRHTTPLRFSIARAAALAWRRPRARRSLRLRLGEYQDRFWANTVELHPLRRGVALECLLERRDVGDLNDPPDPIRARGVPEGAHRDSQWPEELLALR